MGHPRDELGFHSVIVYQCLVPVIEVDGLGPQLRKEPGVLDSYRCLSRENFDKVKIVIRKGAIVSPAVYIDDADQTVLHQYGAAYE